MMGDNMLPRHLGWVYGDYEDSITCRPMLRNQQV